MRRAYILRGPGRIVSGRVCPKCARLGWLLVLGDDAPATRRRTRPDTRSEGERNADVNRKRSAGVLGAELQRAQISASARARAQTPTLLTAHPHCDFVTSNDPAPGATWTCGAKSIAIVNDRGYCQDHLGPALTAMRSTLEKLHKP